MRPKNAMDAGGGGGILSPSDAESCEERSGQRCWARGKRLKPELYRCEEVGEEDGGYPLENQEEVDGDEVSKKGYE